MALMMNGCGNVKPQDVLQWNLFACRWQSLRGSMQPINCKGGKSGEEFELLLLKLNSLLVWFILMERLNTKDRLCKLNCIPPNDIMSAFCSNEPGSLEHLFFTCRFTMKIWYICMFGLVGLVLVCPQESGYVFRCLVGSPLQGLWKRIMDLLDVFTWCFGL